MSSFKVICCHVLWRDVFHYASGSENIYDVTMIEQGLHNTPDMLRESVQAEIDKVQEYIERPKNPGRPVSFTPEAIILGYGLCSNGLNGIQARGLPLIVPKAHDCITIFLGSKERYKEYFDSHPGTYWYTPGWIDTCEYMPGRERYEAKLREYTEMFGEDNAEYLMEQDVMSLKSYTNLTFVDFEWQNGDRYKKHTKDSADWLGLAYEELVGSPDLLKDLLSGCKDDRFVVVPPGKTLVASHDDDILRVNDE